jgi:hypothetical protein
VSHITTDTYAISGLVHTLNQESWWITVVYGPQSVEDKERFLQELGERRALCLGPWLLLGDFNMILRASDKNNRNLNRREMSMLRDFVSD